MERNEVKKMGKDSKLKVIKISKVETDERLYPRAGGYHHLTAYSYSQAMLSGAIFPPIVVADVGKSKYVLIDGRHRLEACKILKTTDIDAEIITGLTEKQIFEEAVRKNIEHGQPLTPYDKRNIALKLRHWKYDPAKISEIIQVPIDKLENFVASRLINAITGKTISEVIVKSGIKNLVRGNEVFSKASIDETNNTLTIGSQIAVITQLKELLLKRMLNVDNKKIRKLLDELKELI